MLDPALKAQLSAYLQNLRTPIELVATLDDSKAGQQTRELLEDVRSASDKVTVRDDSGADVRTPSFLITTPGNDSGVRFAGVPLGHEFTSLVLALLHVGGHPPRHDADLLDAVRALTGPLHFETYFSLTCQNCPDVVQALNTMAALNPQITHTAIEGGAFAAEVTEREVMSVPAVYLNGELFGQGRMELADIVAQLDSGSAEREAAQLTGKEPYDVLVIGGGPAGSTAAMYSARKGIRTGLLADRIGGQVLDTAGIENYPSVPHTEGTQFAAALERHVREYEVDVMARQKAAKLHPAVDDDGLIGVELETGAVLRSRTVVVASGARWRTMGVPGEQEYRNKGVTFCPHCDGPLFKGKPVAVIGGGNSGVEAAIDLAGLASHVTLLEFAGELRADDVLRRKLAGLPNVDVLTRAQTTEVVGDGRKVTGLSYRDRSTDTERTLPVEGVFVQIGLLPNTDWVSGALALNDRGEIVIDAHGATSAPGVFGAGDCTTTPHKQIVAAAGDGAKAALSAFDHLIRN
ncbi:alkyl hydroperoxide reductase subunit F [Actinoplanes couchii]|uniref:Alkyl hydroperoxide reductase subunit F n=1 Tax=Actinoplanes couchii TaxID=403638 RepID=A0ABQ3XEM3_9ACTN|nr:alkyl hydroperoxide reductase subunit F [Actinoplanes couchii]MDR6319807.1 alkyl hydroperoxide reductase subunit F [Actinoplanes couchii]GID56942.1 alkyl hydroperoxide reductase subunit F [Actinoplanes couchii]